MTNEQEFRRNIAAWEARRAGISIEQLQAREAQRAQADGRQREAAAAERASTQGTIKDIVATIVVMFFLLRPAYKIALGVLIVLVTWYMLDGRYSWQGNYRIDRLTGTKEYCSTSCR